MDIIKNNKSKVVVFIGLISSITLYILKYVGYVHISWLIASIPILVGLAPILLAISYLLLMMCVLACGVTLVVTILVPISLIIYLIMKVYESGTK